jgi:radical SAM protein with 4Fe4S-binding SPASM domain
MRREMRILRYYITDWPNKLGSVAKMLYLTRMTSARSLRRPGYSSFLPPLMTLQVNNVCNLRCVQCWEWGDNGVYKGMDPAILRDEMTTRQWEDLIDETSQWKPYIYFFGGEPLLRKDITRLIEVSSRKNLLTALNSNTTLMTEELAEGIVKAGLDCYMASLDGPEEINNKIRKGTNVFEKVTSGIRHLVRAKEKLKSGFPLIEVVTTVTAENADHMIETAEIADSLGVDFFKIQLGMSTTPELLESTKWRFVKTFGIEPKLFEGYVRDTSRIDAESLAKQDRVIRERKWTFEFKRFPKHGIKGFDYRQYYGSPETVFGEKVCHVPWMRAVVLPNGDVVGCSWFPEARLGNVTKQKFVDIWNGSPMKKFRKSLTEDGLFPSCSRCCELYELDESRG